MPNYKVTGLVLRARDFGESDRVLTILDRDLGKVEAVAKGTRRIRSVLRGPCQPFSHSLFLLWQGRNLDGISQAEVIESFAGLREDLARLAGASYMVELVDDVVRERDPSPEVFDLLLQSFRWLAETEPSPRGVTLVLRTFEVRFLGLAGYAPVLDACAICGTPAEAWGGSSDAVFSVAAGGLLCPSCRGAPDGGGYGRAVGAEDDPGGPAVLGPPVIPLAAGTLAAMRHLATVTLERARLLRLTPRAAQEMGRVLRAHILYHLDRQLKSLDFLDSVLG